MKKSVKSLIAIVLIFLLQFSVPLKAGAQDNSSNDEVYNYFKTMMDLIKTKYNGQYDEKMVIQGMLKGLFSNYDPYTTYFTNDEASSFFDTINGHLTGIGVQLSQTSDKVIIGKVYPDSPAEKSGIMAGDTIIAVDDKDVTSNNYQEISDMIRGEKDTSVKVKIKRNSGIEDFSITRGDIEVSPGSYKIDNGIGYIKLGIFSTNAAKFVSDALTYMDSKGISKIVLDLRDNPGGDVEQAVDIASNFVKGDICSLDFKDPSMQDVVYKSPLEKSKYKLAVLVNGNSASASEIVTGAIQDSKAGVIIGTKTFGKAKVQSTIPLLTVDAYEKYSKQIGVNIVDAYELITKYGIEPLQSEIQGWTKITTGRYKTPNGRMIDLQGIEPDIYVKDNSIYTSFSISDITPLSKDNISANGLKEEDIVVAKQLLVLAGYNISELSNILDQSTTTEIGNFQKEHGLEVTGQLNAATIDSLNSILSLANLMDSRSYNKAVEILNNN